MAVESDGDLGFLSIAQAGRLLRARRLSPVELTRAVLGRIERLEPGLHAHITVTAEWALELARAAEADLAAGRDRGPLHGIPLGLKDLFDTAGVRTTAGSRILADNVPAAHAPVVERLLAAGAVIVGKHNMHEFATGITNVNPHYGTAANPWKEGYITGGSSGGSAAALAAGLCLGAMGSDTTCSIRMPAALCGVCGLKPTYGRVSLRGVVPLSWTLDHAGPMARSAEDCALLLDAVAGYDPADPFSVDAPSGSYAATLAGGCRGMRVGLMLDLLEDEHLLPEARAAVERAVETLREAGAEVLEARLPELEAAQASWLDILLVETLWNHAQWTAKRLDEYGPDIRKSMQRHLADPPTSAALAEALRARAVATRAFDRLMERFDALVGPTCPGPALTLDNVTGPDSPLRHYNRYTVPFNVTGLPALTVSCGFTDKGLPLGLMVVGRRWGESAALRLAHAYQQVTDWQLRRPRDMAAEAGSAK